MIWNHFSFYFLAFLDLQVYFLVANFRRSGFWMGILLLHQPYSKIQNSFSSQSQIFFPFLVLLQIHVSFQSHFDSIIALTILFFFFQKR
ncbi:hypothetical protein CW304_24710 [Bacillus sp. UFRGS-B20]|nr:hypothetical protein CW304_24710 [Bacillus sp. UFRGS-B20]